MNRPGNRFNSMGSMGPGILGDGPGLLPQDGPGAGLLGDLPGVGGMQQGMMGNNNMGLIGGDFETLLQQRQLAQQLSMRESQLAMATNMLQQQSQMLEGIAPTGMGGMGSGRMQSGMIPSLLDIPSQPMRKRPLELDRFDFKRQRQDESGRISRWDRNMEEDGHFRRRSRSRDRFHRRSLEAGRRPSLSPRRDQVGNRSGLRNNGQSSYFCHLCKLDCRNDQAFKAHMQSMRHREQLDEIGNLHKRTSQEIAGRIKAQAHLRKLEQTNSTRPGFCKLCDSEIPILFQRHKLTTIHKKREQQVHRGCSWCNVKNFKNFTDVLKHRQTKKHKENEKKFGKKTEDTKKDSSLNEKKIPRRKDDGDRAKDSTKKEEKDKNDKTSPKKEESADSKELSRKDNDDDKNKDSSSKENGDTSKQIEEKESHLEKETEMIINDKDDADPTYNSETAVGQNYVISVTGYFCKLCHKFYNNETAAKVTHCKSQAHFDKWKKARQMAKKKAMAANQAASSSTKSTDKNTVEKDTTEDTVKTASTENTKISIDEKSEDKSENTDSSDDKSEVRKSLKREDSVTDDDILKQDDDTVLDDTDVTGEEDRLLSHDDAHTEMKMADEKETDEDKVANEESSEVLVINEEEDTESLETEETANSELSKGRGRVIKGRKAKRGRK